MAIEAYAFQRLTLKLGYSEVLCHLRVAGTDMRAIVLPEGVQILDEDGTDFSFPVTHAEAGITYLGLPELSDHYKCEGVALNFDNRWHCYTHSIFGVREES